MTSTHTSQQPSLDHLMHDVTSYEDDTPCILEEQQRLSQSILWTLQRQFFDRQGIDAWRQGTVPHYITSNPFLAKAYARVVLGFLRDCLAVTRHADDGACAPLDRSQPLYIIELGAGHGRFASHFLKTFLPVYRASVLHDVPITYVMTDFTERNLDAWGAHPSLQPLLDAGVLDVARFDAATDQELELRHSGHILAPGTLRNPVVVLANYVFDSIPQDAFYVKDGQLYESLVTVSSPQHEPDLHDPAMLSRVEVAYDHHPVTTEYYDDPGWNHMLHHYEQRLADTALLFPTAALQCVCALRHLSGGRLLLVSGDKGDNREDALLGRDEPGIAVHGSFSMGVSNSRKAPNPSNHDNPAVRFS